MRRCLILTAVSVAAIAWGMSAATATGNPAVKPGTVVKVTPSDHRAAKERHYYTIILEDSTLAPVAPAGGLTAEQGVKPGKPHLQWKFTTVMVPAGGFNLDPHASRAAGANQLVVETPTTGQCQVGKRYPSATMEGGGKRYALTDVTITGCSRAGPQERITFVYGQMGVK